MSDTGTATRDHLDHLYDWVIVQRVVTGRGHVPRPLCARELRDATRIMWAAGYGTDTIARRCRVNARHIRDYVPKGNAP